MKTYVIHKIKTVLNIGGLKITHNAKYMASWGLKCATLSSNNKVN